MDHNTKCPMCRTVLLLNNSTQLPVNVTLAALMVKLMPEAMHARREKATEDAAAARAGGGEDGGGEGNLPMFVMDVMLPGQSMQLNIFEPRYRLLIRRCMEGSRRFGMVGYDQGQGRMCEWAVEVEIVECENVADGRYFINILGRRRCRVLSFQDQDGYVLARVKYVKDTANEDEDEGQSGNASTVSANVVVGGGGDASGGEGDMAAAAAEAAARMALTEGGSVGRLAARADTLVQMVLDTLTAMGPGRNLHAVRRQIQAKIASKPPVADIEALSWWMADFLPLSSDHKLRFLQMNTAKERLTEAVEAMVGITGAHATATAAGIDNEGGSPDANDEVEDGDDDEDEEDEDEDDEADEADEADEDGDGNPGTGTG